jgi:hypothetical protein
MVALLGYAAGALGLRLRDPAYTLDHVQLAGGLLIQSMALRNVQVQAAIGVPDEPAHAADQADTDTGTTAGPAGDAAGARDDHEAAAPAAPGVVNSLLNGLIPGPGPYGEPVEWTLAGLSYLGVIDAFMELDPDFTPPAA